MKRRPPLPGHPAFHNSIAENDHGLKPDQLPEAKKEMGTVRPQKVTSTIKAPKPSVKSSK